MFLQRCSRQRRNSSVLKPGPSTDHTYSTISSNNSTGENSDTQLPIPSHSTISELFESLTNRLRGSEASKSSSNNKSNSTEVSGTSKSSIPGPSTSTVNDLAGPSSSSQVDSSASGNMSESPTNNPTAQERQSRLMSINYFIIYYHIRYSFNKWNI